MRINGYLNISDTAVATFCRKWKVKNLALFGSVLRDDFGPESDIDVLVEFAPAAPWTLFELCRMERELGQVLGRDVDLLTRQAAESMPNWIRREEILRTARSLYAA